MRKKGYLCAMLGDESNPVPMQRAFDAPISLLSTEEEPALQIMRLRRGTDLAGYSLLAALLLLALEYILGLQFNGRSKVTKQGGR